jgi:hypothetical protein
MTIADCPLARQWMEWDVDTERRFRLGGTEERRLANEAREARRGKQLRRILAEWEVAEDDASRAAPPEDIDFEPGFPQHLHAQFDIDTNLVHVDYVAAEFVSPPRRYVEIRIYVRGLLAGRGGASSTSMGYAESAELPALALIGSELLLGVWDDRSIILWQRL